MTTYKDAGVDISVADAMKKAIAASINTGDPRMLNRHGAFASLVEGSFPGYEHPVLVLKTEEPGSKQKLAFENNRIASICEDTINHLINDIIVTGATPLYVQDAVICGKIEKDVVVQIVRGFADACKTQQCILTGGETSEQPGVLSPGRYILTASIVGIVEKKKIIDGSKITVGDRVLAFASSGLHTNGFTLVRKLMEEHPAILKEQIDGRSFLDAILTPHRCYFQLLKGLFGNHALHGLAHITGGGIGGNLDRILPKTVDASIDCSRIDIPDIFKLIHRYGHVPATDMLRTYNLGVGLTAVVAQESVPEVQKHCKKFAIGCTEIGTIVAGGGRIMFKKELSWE